MKKKHFIGLSTLLLVLLLGLFSTTYARTLSATDIMNFALNGYVYKTNSTPSQTIIDNVKAHEQDFEEWAELTETYEGQYGLAHYGSNLGFFYYYGSQTNLNSHSPYYYSNKINVNSSYLTRKIGYYVFSEDSFYSFSNGDMGIGASNRFLYVDFDVKLNANNAYPGGVNLYTAGTCLPDSSIFAENFVSSDKFEFSPTTTNFEVCSINGLVQPSEVYVYERTTQNYLTLGYLEKFSNLDNISITQYRYNRSNGWVEVSEWATDDFSGYNVQDDILTYTIDVSKISADTLVLFNFTPNNIQDFTNQTFALYIKSPYTVISNGVIYPSQTFSGDYYNNYNDDSNTDKIVDNNKSDSDKIIDTLTDDSQVDNILAETFSGDIEDFAHEFGFTPLDNPFTTFLIYVIQGSYDALTGTGNVTLSANYRNYLDFEFKSQDFTTPDSAFKTFLSSMLVCWYLYGNYKYFHYLISLIETAKIDKAVAELGTDEFYDTDIM